MYHPYPSTATRHRLLGSRRRKEAFSHTDSDRALNCEFVIHVTSSSFTTLDIQSPRNAYTEGI